MANQYMTHHCGELRLDHLDQRARLSGWVHRIRDHGGVTFIDLRDHYGITQVVVEPSSPVSEEVRALRPEWVVTVEGKVAGRGEGNENQQLPTGAIELFADTLVVQSRSEVLPFQVADDDGASEMLRLKYRFLDLRRERMHRNIILRSQVIASIRRHMTAQDFLEIQTPILTASSPEGARDYLVPSRVHPGKFYALPQAPQQFKQLLMVAGFHRYFQIAPCFRDEDARADRSPGEFYQLDLEMAFVTQEDVFAAVETVFDGVFGEFSSRPRTPVPFPRITYKDAMRKYGTDKPDMRIPLEIHDVSHLFAESDYRVFRGAIDKGGVVRALPVAGLAGQARQFFDTLVSFVQQNGGKGMGWVIFPEGEAARGQTAKFLDTAAMEALAKLPGASNKADSPIGQGGGCLLLAGPEKETAKLAGLLRVEVARRLGLIEEGDFRFLWVVDFPMYERNEEGVVEFSHNPFSMPQGGLEALDSRDPEEVLAYQYDIVCNGVELSSGAIRNHRPDIMYRAFAIAGYSEEDVNEQFGGMLRAFRMGAPPHGGLAPGVDRIVMLLADEPNLREVVAFPMTAKAEDVLMGAPASVSEEQLQAVHLKLALPPKKPEKPDKKVDQADSGDSGKS